AGALQEELIDARALRVGIVPAVAGIELRRASPGHHEHGAALVSPTRGTPGGQPEAAEHDHAIPQRREGREDARQLVGGQIAAGAGGPPVREDGADGALDHQEAPGRRVALFLGFEAIEQADEADRSADAADEAAAGERVGLHGALSSLRRERAGERAMASSTSARLLWPVRPSLAC